MGLGVVEGTEIPERWIGREVVISMISASTTRTGEDLPLEGAVRQVMLEDMTDRGVVITYPTDTRKRPRRYFHPWGAILGITPSGDR